MSKVKLRSRSYKLSRGDISNVITSNKFRFKFRFGDFLNKFNETQPYYDQSKRKLTKSNSFTEPPSNHSLNKLVSPTCDKSFECSTAETSSLGSQSTSQLSSGISLESIEFCKWQQCRFDWITCDNPLYSQPKALIADELENHLMNFHVKPQLTTKRKFFECLWTGCKVFKKKSLSYNWLERHVIEHTENKNKPFSCIFQCSMRFSSQALLEKHVQSHIMELNPVNEKVPVNLDNDISINFRSKKSCSHNKKLSHNYLTSYSVHRDDFIDKNRFAQIQTNTLLKTVVIDPDILKEYGLDFLIDQPLPPQVIRLMTHEFKIMGKRKPLNRITQTLIQWVLPGKLKINTEWINDNFIQLAEYLSINKRES